MTVTIEIGEDGAMLVPLQGAALGPETQAALRRYYRRELQSEFEREDDRIGAWHKVATHPFFKDCYRTRGPLIDAMLAKLDRAEAPDAKPWHDAEQDEVWVLTILGAFPPHAPRQSTRLVSRNKTFVDVKSRMPAISIFDTGIIDGQRIWPREEN